MLELNEVRQLSQRLSRQRKPVAEPILQLRDLGHGRPHNSKQAPPPLMKLRRHQATGYWQVDHSEPPSDTKHFTAFLSPQYLHLTMKPVFRLLNEMVRDGAIPNYAIGGAIGAVFYVEPFATQDVDVFVLMDSEPGRLVTSIPGWTYLNDRGYTEIRGEAIVIGNWPVQFIPVSNELEEEAYLNAVTVDFEGEPVRVMLAEHLVAIMLNTGRLKDRARVQMFLSQDAVDVEILGEIIKRYGLETSWAEFQNL